MESEQSGQEKSDQEPIASAATEEQQQQQQSSTVRSYECTFCKRGFTNAQALGGHMNIHRKDKAKFKQPDSPSPTRSQRLIIYPEATTASIPIPAATPISPFSISPQGRSWLSSSPPKETEKKPLPLFGHESSGVVSRNVVEESVEKDTREPEVDLELRLGHVDQPSTESSSGSKGSAASTATRKFF